ncbi:MAG: hypothetical protein AB2L20_22485 [Mangrovibacterium sp.]
MEKVNICVKQPLIDTLLFHFDFIDCPGLLTELLAQAKESVMLITRLYTDTVLGLKEHGIPNVNLLYEAAKM